MSKLEDFLGEQQDIPLKEAADFYLGTKEAATREELYKARDKGLSAGITQATKNKLVDSAHRGERKGKAIGGALGALAGTVAGKTLLKGNSGAAIGAAAGYLSGSGLGKEYGRDRDLGRKPRGKKKEASAVGKAKKVIKRGKELVTGSRAKDYGNRNDDIFKRWMKTDPATSAARRVENAYIKGLGKTIAEDSKVRKTRQALVGAGAAAGLGGALYAAKKEAAMSAAFSKVAFNDGNGGGDMATPMANTTEPTNYIQAELQGREAQEENEASFYRQAAQQAQAEAQQATEQAQALEGQLAQAQQQAESVGQQAQQATAQAVQAQDEILQKSQIAANLRIGMQKQRAMMMDVASQDPAQLAAMEMQAGPAGQPGAMQPGAPDAQMEESQGQEGPAAQAPGAQAQQPQQPQGADPQMMQPAGAKQASMAQTLKRNALPAAGALGGGLAGAALGMRAGSPESLAKGEESLKQLRAKENGFLNAMRLAIAEGSHAKNVALSSSPAAAASAGALPGALAGMAAGSGANRLVGNLAAIRNLKNVR